ncbi:MAG: RHS repeat protein [Armatimonadota bacterium]|nr:RHS repeat protein [Armatimonadota bacterium]
MYNKVKNWTRIDYANGTYSVFEYDEDPRYRMETITHYKDGSPPTELLSIDYPERDGAGNPLSMVDSNGTTYYSYDNNSRLAAVTYPGQSQITFGYDWVGNQG